MPPQQGHHCLPAGVSVRQQLQHLGRGEREPPVTPRPGARRPPGLGVGPELAAALVPAVGEQAGDRVPEMLLEHRELVHRLAERVRLCVVAGERREERRRSPRAVRPHLVRPVATLPESSVARARLRAQLRAELRERRVPTGIARRAAQREDQPARRHLVDVGFLAAPAVDRAVDPDDALHALPHEAPAGIAPLPVGRDREPGQQKGVAVVPAHPRGRKAREDGFRRPRAPGPFGHAVR